MLKLEIEATDAVDLKRQLAALLSAPDSAAAPVGLTLTAGTTAAIAKLSEEAPKPQTARGPGRPRKATTTEPAPADAKPAASDAGQAPAEAPSAGEPNQQLAPADALTFDQFKERLQKVSADLPDGHRHVVAVLQADRKAADGSTVSYAKVKEVKPEHYAPMLAELDALLAEAAQS